MPDTITNRSARRVIAWAFSAVLALTVVAVAPVAAQEPGPSVPDLVEPGTGPSTTVPPTTVAAPGEPVATTTTEAPSSGDTGLAASTKVWIIVGALVGVALLILGLTVLYWRHTRPARPEDAEEPEAEAQPPVQPQPQPQPQQPQPQQPQPQQPQPQQPQPQQPQPQQPQPQPQQPQPQAPPRQPQPQPRPGPAPAPAPKKPRDPSHSIFARPDDPPPE